MIVGLGTGSTADAVIRELGRRVADGLIFTGVATSCRTEALARDLGIPLTTLDEVDRLDLGIDGADEIDPTSTPSRAEAARCCAKSWSLSPASSIVLVATTEKNVARLGERTATAGRDRRLRLVADGTAADDCWHSPRLRRRTMSRRNLWSPTTAASSSTARPDRSTIRPGSPPP